METIGESEIWSFFDDSPSVRKTKSMVIRHGAGHRVTSYFELATKVAELQFRNRDHVLLFRGQNADYLDHKHKTTLRPRLFRRTEAGNPNPDELRERFDSLKRAGAELVRLYRRADYLGTDRLERYQVLRWAILQHYEVCATPLLDVTQSLRIAASFASQAADGDAFLFVLGVPNLSGAVTASAEAGLQAIRLSSVCPPCAVRPHIQEGYLLGEYPEMSGWEQKEHYHFYEIDFGRRLVAKFRFDPRSFWKSHRFPKIGADALYPSAADDLFCGLILEVKHHIAVGTT
jgi:hypothetical protein